MADARDTNHDGKVSLMEKVKDKLHMGHKDSAEYSSTTTHTTTHAHTTTTAVPVATGAVLVPVVAAAVTTSAVTTGAATAGTAYQDSSHVHQNSSHTHQSASGVIDESNMTPEQIMTLHEERLAISKRQVAAGEVGIHKHVQAERVEQTVPVRREEVIVERRPLSGVADPNARIAAQDETIRVALTKEQVIAEKRVVPTEEVIVRKQQVVENQTVGATLRSEYVDTTTNVTTAAGTHDSRDKNHDGHVSGVEKVQGALKK